MERILYGERGLALHQCQDPTGWLQDDDDLPLPGNNMGVGLPAVFPKWVVQQFPDWDTVPKPHPFSGCVVIGRFNPDNDTVVTGNGQ